MESQENQVHGITIFHDLSNRTRRMLFQINDPKKAKAFIDFTEQNILFCCLENK